MKNDSLLTNSLAFIRVSEISQAQEWALHKTGILLVAFSSFLMDTACAWAGIWTSDLTSLSLNYSDNSDYEVRLQESGVTLAFLISSELCRDWASDYSDLLGLRILYILSFSIWFSFYLSESGICLKGMSFLMKDIQLWIELNLKAALNWRTNNETLWNKMTEKVSPDAQK